MVLCRTAILVLQIRGLGAEHAVLFAQLFFKEAYFRDGNVDLTCQFSIALKARIYHR
jgi:hypothetical protein